MPTTMPPEPPPGRVAHAPDGSADRLAQQRRHLSRLIGPADDDGEEGDLSAPAPLAPQHKHDIGYALMNAFKQSKRLTASHSTKGVDDHVPTI